MGHPCNHKPTHGAACPLLCNIPTHNNYTKTSKLKSSKVEKHIHIECIYNNVTCIVLQIFYCQTLSFDIALLDHVRNIYAKFKQVSSSLQLHRSSLDRSRPDGVKTIPTQPWMTVRKEQQTHLFGIPLMSRKFRTRCSKVKYLGRFGGGVLSWSFGLNVNIDLASIPNKLMNSCTVSALFSGCTINTSPLRNFIPARLGKS